MFSLRLLVAVAGALLLLDTNQAKSANTQKSSTSKPKSTEFLKAAKKENSAAIALLSESVKAASRKGVRMGLSLARGELDKLLKKTTTERLAHLATAFAYELFGFFKPNECKNESKCNETYVHIQRAAGKMMAVALTEVTDETKKNDLKNIIGENITEEGNIPEGVTVQQTREVTVQVRDFLFNL